MRGEGEKFWGVRWSGFHSGGGGGVKMGRIFFMWHRGVGGGGPKQGSKNIILCRYDQTCLLNPKYHLHILGQYNYQESYVLQSTAISI